MTVTDVPTGTGVPWKSDVTQYPEGGAIESEHDAECAAKATGTWLTEDEMIGIARSKASVSNASRPLRYLTLLLLTFSMFYLRRVKLRFMGRYRESTLDGDVLTDFGVWSQVFLADLFLFSAETALDSLPSISSSDSLRIFCISFLREPILSLLIMDRSHKFTA